MSRLVSLLVLALVAVAKAISTDRVPLPLIRPRSGVDLDSGDTASLMERQMGCGPDGGRDVYDCDLERLQEGRQAVRVLYFRS